MWFLLILANLAVASAMAAVLLASGARIRRLLRLPTGPGDRWAVDLVLGAFLCGLWVLALGLAGLLRPILLLVGVILQGTFGRWRGVHRPMKPMMVAGVAGIPNLLIALGPPHFYDAMVYHLGLPWQALQDGAWLAHPENVFAAFPPLSQLVSTLPLSVGALSAPALLHWFSWAVAAVAAGAVARRLGASPLLAHGLTAAAMLLSATPLVPGFPAAEGWFLAALIPALGAVVGSTCRSSTLPGSMLLLGTACAFRLQGPAWGLIFGLVWIARTRDVKSIVRALPWAVAGTAPWWLKNAILLGDPVAPVFWRREGIDTLWRDGASLLRLGRQPFEILLGLPRYLAAVGPVLGPVLLGSTLAATKNPRTRPALWAAALSLGAWAATGSLPRFLAPTMILLLISVAAWRLPKGIHLVAGALLMWSLIIGSAAQARWLLLVQPVKLLSLNFADAAFLVAPNPPFNAYLNLETLLPAETRIMVVGDARGFGLPRPFVVTSQHDPSPLRSLVETANNQQITEDLRNRGITHLVVNSRELQRLADNYPIAPWKTTHGEARWWSFVRSLGPPLEERDGVGVYCVSLPKLP
ncbi:MAG: hypothetical protein K8R59_02450 [Thermoanaerobaculales bacterium]|nr:hypothetical protein [Thermoanaerobaculales bacterium]